MTPFASMADNGRKCTHCRHECKHMDHTLCHGTYHIPPGHASFRERRAQTCAIFFISFPILQFLFPTNEDAESHWHCTNVASTETPPSQWTNVLITTRSKATQVITHDHWPQTPNGINRHRKPVGCTHVMEGELSYQYLHHWAKPSLDHSGKGEHCPHWIRECMHGWCTHTQWHGYRTKWELTWLVMEQRQWRQ